MTPVRPGEVSISPSTTLEDPVFLSDLPRCTARDAEMRPCIRPSGHTYGEHHFVGDSRPQSRRSPLRARRAGPSRSRLRTLRCTPVADYDQVLAS